MREMWNTIISKDEGWYVGECPEVAGANGQGRTIDECRQNLFEAIALVLEDRLGNPCRDA